MTIPDRPLVFGDLLTLVASWLLLGCAAWSVLIGVAAILELSTRGRLRATSWVGCPPGLRRFLFAGLGAVLVTTPGQTPAGIAASIATPRSPGGSVAGPLPVPARPVGAGRASPASVVVRPGDTLWQLAESRLPPETAASAVAELVARLHRRNRAVIGPDPGLIRPGQRLVLPQLPRHEPTPDDKEIP